MKEIITLIISFIIAMIMLYILCFMIFIAGIVSGNIDPHSQDELSNHYRIVLSKLK